MEYSFGCDTSKLTELGEVIDGEISNINNAVNDIYSVIDSFSSDKVWSGEAYESFKTETHKYKEDLEDMIEVLKAYNKILKNVEVDANTLCDDVVSVINAGE